MVKPLGHHIAPPLVSSWLKSTWIDRSNGSPGQAEAILTASCSESTVSMDLRFATSRSFFTCRGAT